MFDSQHPGSTSQLSITLISEDMKLPFWPPVGTRHTHVHRHAQQAKHLYESINFLKKLRKDSIRSGLEDVLAGKALG